MLIESIAPSRISLFGGGTDVDSYALEYGGRTISFAINLYQHITLYTNGDSLFASNSFPQDADPILFQSMIAQYEVDGVISSRFDGRIGAGLGSSASSAVCLLGAIAKCRKLPLKRDTLAHLAYLHEQKLGWYGGRQDQYASSYGGFNVLEFGNGVTVTPLTREVIEPLLPSFVLLSIGGSRKSSKIQRGLEHLSSSQIKILHEIKKLTVTAENFIQVGNIKELGQLLDIGWQLKKQSNKGVSNQTIDDIYEEAKKHGAYGGKILGAGGCGYMFFMVEPEKRQYFINNMLGLEPIDFSVDWNGVGARIL